MEILELDGKSETLTVHELTIESEEVVKFIAEFEEDKRLDVLRDIIQLGVKAYKSFLTESYGKSIDSHFMEGISRLDLRISNKMNDIDKKVLQPFIDEVNKKVVEKFTKEFDDKKDRLLKDLDEKKDKIGNDVLGKFMKEFAETSDKLQMELTKFVAKEEVISATTLKGKRFEDYVFDLASDVADSFGDYVEHIGIDDVTGDVIIESSDKTINFCIEIKDRKVGSEPEIKRIFEEIERKRLVGHSMMIFRSFAQIPEKVGPFRLYGTNRMVLTLSEEDEDLKPYLLKVGYRIMRLLVKHDGDGKKIKSVDKVVTVISDIKTKLQRVTSIKKSVTEFSEKLHTQLDSLRGDIEELLLDMETDLSSV